LFRVPDTTKKNYYKIERTINFYKLPEKKRGKDTIAPREEKRYSWLPRKIGDQKEPMERE